MMNKVKNFLFSALPVLITGGLCSYFTRWGVADWYAQFDKPLYVPPGYVFSLAWGIIYALLIASYYRVLNTDSNLKPLAGRLFWQQLPLQVLWCFLFFYQGMLLAAFVVILWLIYTVLRMTGVFSKIDMTAGALNYFYIFYICYAAFLNFAFLYANGYVLNF